MASKYIKIHSISFLIKEMQIKAMAGYRYTQCLKWKRLTLPTVGEEVGQLKVLDIVSRSGNLFNHFGKIYGSFSPS